jgi:hypothetical protein
MTHQQPAVPTGPLGTYGWDPDDHLWRAVTGTPARLFWGRLGNTVGQVCPPGVWTRIVFSTTAGDLAQPGLLYDRLNILFNGMYMWQCALILSGNVPGTAILCPIMDDDTLTADPVPREIAGEGIEYDITQYYDTTGTISIGAAIFPEGEAATIAGPAPAANLQVVCLGEMP